MSTGVALVFARTVSPGADAALPNEAGVGRQIGALVVACIRAMVVHDLCNPPFEVVHPALETPGPQLDHLLFRRQSRIAAGEALRSVGLLLLEVSLGPLELCLEPPLPQLEAL